MKALSVYTVCVCVWESDLLQQGQVAAALSEAQQQGQDVDGAGNLRLLRRGHRTLLGHSKLPRNWNTQKTLINGQAWILNTAVDKNKNSLNLSQRDWLHLLALCLLPHASSDRTAGWTWGETQLNAIFDVLCGFNDREFHNVFNCTWTVQTPHRKQTAHPQTVLPCELYIFAQAKTPTTTE